MRKVLTVIILATLLLTGCTKESETAKHNSARASDNFEINRRITFINNVTGEYLYTIEGLCSVSTDGSSTNITGALEVTCKTGEDMYERHVLGLNAVTTYVVEQIEPNEQDPYRMRIIWRPESIIPDIEIQ